jgi:ABC-2 type transport system permease protein
MTALQTIALVARRELVERAATKGYLIGTLVTLVIVVGLVVVPTFFGGDDELRLGVAGTAPADLDEQVALGLPEDVTLTVTAVDDRADGERAVEDGELDALLVDGAELVADGAPDGRLRVAVEAAVQRLEVAQRLDAAGLDDTDAAALLGAPTPLTVVDLAGEEADDQGTAAMLAFVATLLLFIGIQGNSATLLSAALEEKSSRVIEVLVSVARPWQLLAGKLLALTLLALVQLGLTVAAGLGANAAVGAFELPAITGGLVAISLVMLVVGFLFYAALFAVAGSMASSLEDAQSTSGPLTFAVMAGYFAVIFAVMPNPDGLVSRVLTFLPPTAPFVVPARTAFGALPVWEVVLATLLTLVTAAIVVRIAGRLYAAALLAGGKLSWSATWKAEPVR